LHLIIAPSPARPQSGRSSGQPGKLPGTFAGLIRAALAGGDPLPPETVCYEHGDPKWFQSVPRVISLDKRAAGSAPPLPGEKAPVVRLAPAARRRWRGLERVSPSQFEAASAVDLAQRLRLGAPGAMERGTVIHAWLCQIEWLDEGEPDDALLCRIGAPLACGTLDLEALVAQFRAMLAQPAIRSVLSRSAYSQPPCEGAASPAQAGPHVARPCWKVWRERPFALREHDAVTSGRFDRLVLLCDGDQPAGAEVIDFKTDSLPADDPRAVESRLESYRPQLQAYSRAAAALLGVELERVLGKIVWVELGLVTTVR